MGVLDNHWVVHKDPQFDGETDGSFDVFFTRKGDIVELRHPDGTRRTLAKLLREVNKPNWLVEDVLTGKELTVNAECLGLNAYNEMEVLAWVQKFG